MKPDLIYANFIDLTTILNLIFLWLLLITYCTARKNEQQRKRHQVMGIGIMSRHVTKSTSELIERDDW